VIPLYPGDNDRSLDGHVPFMDGDLAGGNAYADIQARALSSSMGESGDIGLVSDLIEFVSGHQAAGDTFFLGPNGDPLVKALIHPVGKAYMDRRPLRVIVFVGHAASSCCWQ
jgi:hypothetical protein